MRQMANGIARDNFSRTCFSADLFFNLVMIFIKTLPTDFSRDIFSDIKKTFLQSNYKIQPTIVYFGSICSLHRYSNNKIFRYNLTFAMHCQI